MKRENESTLVVKRLLSDAVPAKTDKWRRRADALIREAPTPEERLKALRELLRRSQIELYGRSANARYTTKDPINGMEFDTETLEAVQAFSRHLAATVADLGEVRIVLRLQTEMLKTDTMTRAMTTEPDLYLVDMMACMRFFLDYFDLVGSSQDRAISFALQLIDLWERTDSRDLSVADLPKVRDRSRPPPKEFPATTMDGVMAGLFIIEVGSEPLAPLDGPRPADRKAWLCRLIEATSSSAAAEEVLVSILDIQTFFNNRTTLQTLRDKHVVSEKLQQAIQRFQHHQGVQRFFEYAGAPRLILPEETRKRFDRWSERRVTSFLRAKEEGEKSIHWFQRNREEIAKAFDTRCRAIMEEPRRGLRPGGYDHVEIRVAALRNAGVRAVIFHPEGCDFPDAKVHILVRKETPTLYTFRTDLRNFELATHEEIVLSKIHLDHRAELEGLLEFVVIDILYRIVAAKKELREKKARWTSTGSADQMPSPRTIPVRPFLRRLQDGHRASPEAQENAHREMGWRSLPKGLTFVSATYRGEGQLVYALPTQPTAIYTDEDFLSMVEWS